MALHPVQPRPPLAAVLHAAALQARRSGAARVVVLTTLAALLVPLLWTALLPQADRTAQRMLVDPPGQPPVVALLVVAGWWWLFLSSLLLQNQPNAARLLPGQLRALRLAFIGGWIVAGPVLALAAALLWGWALLPAITWCAALLVVTWVVRWPVLLAGVWLPPMLWRALWRTGLPQPALDWLAGMPLFCAAAVTGAALLHAGWLLQAGGDAHRRSNRRADEVRQQASAGNFARLSPWQHHRWLAALQRLFLLPYRLALARAGRRANDPAASRQPDGLATSRSGDATPASAVRRALYVLGPSAHWTGQALAFAIFTSVLVLVLPLLWGLGVSLDRLGNGALLGAAPGVMVLALNPLLQLRSAMFHTRREQALLVLLPGMPRGPALARAIAWRLWTLQVLAWLPGALGVWLLTGAQWSPLTIATVAGTLPFTAHVLRGWSLQRDPAGGSGLLLSMLGLCSSVLALWALQRLAGWSVAAVVAAAIGATVVVTLAGVWRLRRVAAPWPTGWRVGASGA